MTYVLAIYEIDRAYGGPEEGGWWYDTGELVRVIATTRSEARAHAAARRANSLIERLQVRKTPVCSVNYEGGRHRALVEIDKPTPFFPQERPTYS